MPTTTANMALSKPTIDGDAGLWDTYINASLDLIDLHDHSSGKGVKVTAAGLNLTTDVTLAGTGAIINAKLYSFTEQATFTPVARSFYVKSSDSELYYRNSAGTEIKVTSGSSLNLSLVGGIAGDYAAAGASFYYDDTNKTYRALQAAPLPNVWASVSAGDLDLYQKASGITNRVRLSSPAALAASYALTFPAALPGSTVLAQVSSAGVLTFTNTLNTSLVMAVNLDITISGTGKFKHGDKTLSLDSGAFASSSTAFAMGASGVWAFDGARTIIGCIPIPNGARIRSVKYYYLRTAGTLTFLVTTLNNGSRVVLDTTTDAAAAGWTNKSTPALDYTIAADTSVRIEVVADNAAQTFGTAVVTYDQP